MGMRSYNSPRRVYTYAGSPVICYSGAYYGPKADATSQIRTDKEVHVLEHSSVGGRTRIAVTQRVGKNTVSEVWIEKRV